MGNICTWHWICLVCMPCVHIDAPSLRDSSVGLLLCMLWGWGSSLNALTGPLYFELPGLLAPGGHSWVPFQALPSADTSCLPEVLLPPQGSPPLLLADLGVQKPKFVWGTPLKGHLSSRVSCPGTEVSVATTLQFEFFLCGVQLPAPLRKSVSKITPQKASSSQTVSMSRVCFLGKSTYNNVISWKWACLLFEQWHNLKCSVKQSKAGWQIRSWTYTFSLIKAGSYRQVGLPPSQS